MIRRLFWPLWTVALLVCLTPVGAFWQSRDSNYNANITASGGGCAALTTFLARTSGTTANEQTAYSKIICDGTTHGWYPQCDAVYWFATNTTTTANLNLVSASFGITVTATETFTADRGYAGNGTTGFLDTGFTPSTSGVNYTTNSSSVGVYQLTSRATGQDFADIGASDITPLFVSIFPKFTDNNAYAQFTGNASAATANAQAMWVGSRTSSTAITLYKNGTSFASSSGATLGLPTTRIFIGASSNTGNVGGHFSTDQIAGAFICAGFNATDAQNASNDLNAAAAVLGINVF